MHLCGFGFLPLGIRIPTVRSLIEPFRSALRRFWLGLRRGSTRPPLHVQRPVLSNAVQSFRSPAVIPDFAITSPYGILRVSLQLMHYACQLPLLQGFAWLELQGDPLSRGLYHINFAFFVADMPFIRMPTASTGPASVPFWSLLLGNFNFASAVEAGLVWQWLLPLNSDHVFAASLSKRSLDFG